MSTILSTLPASPPARRMTEEEYLAFERHSTEKHELHHGYLLPMSGASFQHNRIVSNMHIFLGYILRDQDFSVFQSDMRVRNPLTEGYYYPDLVVVRGEPSFADGEFDSLLNPVLISEILSPSTSSNDRSGKFTAYQSIPSLTEYILVAADRLHVSHYRKLEDNRWEIRMYTNETDELPLLDATVNMPLAEIYRRVKF
jgi:Uma2 family endonuclease